MLPTRMQVAVRLRPRLSSESHEAEAVLATSNHRVQLVTTPRARRPMSYKFDHVFTPTDSNEVVFDTYLKPLVRAVLNGTHATVLAYGQTGTGKTFTMLGRDLWGLCAGVKNDQQHGVDEATDEPATQRGLMYLVADALLASRRGPVTCSYLELYNEKVFDLTKGSADDDDKVPLDLREDAVHGVFLPDLRVHPVHSLQTLTDILWRGAQTRASRATNMNERSSRSHTILQLHVDAADGSTATMNLVDLAGSEKCKKHSTPRHFGQDMKELKFINQSLSTLAQCISALARRDRTPHHGPSWTGISTSAVHVPYRNSKLTRLLQPSLGGGGLCAFIVTLNPCKSSAQETLSTLQFASRAMKVTCEPCVEPRAGTKSPPQHRDDTVVTALREENQALREALAAERLQKRTLLLGFTSLLSSDSHSKLSPPLEPQDSHELADDLLVKLSTVERTMRSQLQDVQATKLALSTTIRSEPEPQCPLVDGDCNDSDSQELASDDSTWDEYVDASTGFKYFHNASTGVTTWTKPQHVRVAHPTQSSARHDNE